MVGERRNNSFVSSDYASFWGELHHHQGKKICKEYKQLTCSKIITFHTQQLCLQEAPSSPYVAVGVRQNVNNQLKINKQLTWSKFRIFHSQHLCIVSVIPYLIVWQKVNNQLKVNKQLTCSKILTFHTQQLCIASMRPYLPLHCSIWQILPEERRKKPNIIYWLASRYGARS